MTLQRYSIHTPPYARGQLVEDERGQVLKLLDVTDTLNDALFALERARKYPDANPYQIAEIDSAVLAIREIVGHKAPAKVSEHA